MLFLTLTTLGYNFILDHHFFLAWHHNNIIYSNDIIIIIFYKMFSFAMFYYCNHVGYIFIEISCFMFS